MNPTVDWDMVMSRPLVDLPKRLEEPMIKSFSNTNNFIERCWRNIWIPNITENKRIVGDFSKYGVYNIYGTKQGKTAFLVGGGPSLKHNIDDLVVNGNDVWVSAHTLKFLIGKGIRPDYTVVLDGKDVQAEWLDIGDESKGLTLLMDIHCSTKIFDIWKGPIIFYRSTAPSEDDFTREQYKITDFNHVVMSGGNVITTAYAIIANMGYSRVVFIGNDLSNDIQDFRPQYADGSFDDGFRDKQERIEKNQVNQSVFTPFLDRSIEIDIQGKGVCSLNRMFHYKYWLDWQSENNVQIEHINATEAGILGAYPEGNLRSIKQMRLKEVEV